MKESRQILVVGAILVASITIPAWAAGIGVQRPHRAPEARRHRATVELPAGSVDGLAEALAQAGKGGTVIVKSGLHLESGTVLVTERVTIRGEPGAVIQSTLPPTLVNVVEALLHVKDTARVTIRGLEMRPGDDSDGNTAVLVEDSDRVWVIGNTITGSDVGSTTGLPRGFQWGVLVQNGDHVSVENNDIRVSGSWLEGQLPRSDGVIVINGRFARIVGNTLSYGVFGAFASDRGGQMRANTFTNNLYGMILCNVPAATFVISGQAVGSEVPATRWHVHDNLASNSFNTGYLVIDGANRNHMSNNAGSGNAAYDIELAGETNRFGFFAPASRHNQVAAGSHHGLVIKDCGQRNRLKGFDAVVDTTTDPCF